MLLLKLPNGTNKRSKAKKREKKEKKHLRIVQLLTKVFLCRGAGGKMNKGKCMGNRRTGYGKWDVLTLCHHPEQICGLGISLEMDRGQGKTDK